MRKMNLGRSTRSIYLSLAFLSLALHLLLAFFCLSVLQTACVLPSTTSSASISRPATPRQEPVSSSSSSSLPAASHPSLPAIPRDEKDHNLIFKVLNPKDSFGDATDEEKKLIGTGKLIEKVKGQDKLAALFNHPLYNVPLPELQGDDWLLMVKQHVHAKDTESDAHSDSAWHSTSHEEGYDKVVWTSNTETHPPWLRFHLGISRWELYNRKDPNLAQLTQYMATQRFLGAVQKGGGTQLKLRISFPNYGQALLKPMNFTSALGVGYIMVCTANYPNVLAFCFLDELQKEFIVTYETKRISSAVRPYSFIEFDTFIQKTKQRYNSLRSLSTKINLAVMQTEIKLRPPYQLSLEDLQGINGFSVHAHSKYKGIAPTQMLEPVTLPGIVSCVLCILCGGLNLLRGVHAIESILQNDDEDFNYVIAFFLGTAACLYQCYLFAYFSVWRNSKSFLAFALICLSNMYLYELRNVWQILFHVAVAGFMTLQIRLRQPLGKAPDYNV